MITDSKKTVLSIILHPVNYYPPTLNALVCLQMSGYNVISYSKDSKESLIELGKTGIQFHSIERPKLLTFKLNNILHILKFTFIVIKSILRNKPDVILFYEDTALLTVSPLKYIIPKKTIIWYHNHDLIEKGQSKFSLSWFSKISQNFMFDRINIFTIPAEERIPFFPNEKFIGKLIFLPNYPAKWLYNKFESPKTINKESIKLIYQGRISEGHGLMELIDYIGLGKKVELKIIGNGSIEDLELLKSKIKSKYLETKVAILEPVENYMDLPKITNTCQIGIAINIPKSVHYETAGTASNKIYEYSALGLPILYYDNKHYRKYLEKYEWAFPTDLTERSLDVIIDTISTKYNQLSISARKDFNDYLYFEDKFEVVLNHLKLSFADI